MKRRAVSRTLILLAGLAFFLAPGNGSGSKMAQDSLALRQSRGKQIYLRGTTPSGKDILAYLGEASIEVPGSAMACANCHGLDGQGKPEGGVNPSNLTWEALTKPYGLNHADGRRHPAYTERGLELAITRGLDPAGNKLLNVMPRYQMSKEDLEDLIFYLQRLGKDRDPGISENKIVIATLMPTKGPLAEMGLALSAVTSAFFDELNSQGGIYGRRLELKVIGTEETPAATRASVEHLLKDQTVFAMSGALIAGSEKEIIPLLAEQGIPLIGPFTLYPQTDFPLNRQVFYLLSGLDGQARSLVNFVASKPEFKNPSIAVVYPHSDINVGVLEAIKDQNKKNRLRVPQLIEYVAGHFDAAETIKQLKQNIGEMVFFLGNSDEALSFMREAERLNWFPNILVPSASVGTGIFEGPARFDRKVFFSFPTSPADQSEAALKEFRALAEKYKLTPKYLAAQISAYAAANILVEAMKRAGKDLSREKLIQELEGFYEYPTGLTPTITYGPNRRIGARGAYIVTIDLKEKRFVPLSAWVDSN